MKGRAHPIAVLSASFHMVALERYIQEFLFFSTSTVEDKVSADCNLY